MKILGGMLMVIFFGGCTLGNKTSLDEKAKEQWESGKKTIEGTLENNKAKLDEISTKATETGEKINEKINAVKDAAQKIDEAQNAVQKVVE